MTRRKMSLMSQAFWFYGGVIMLAFLLWLVFGEDVAQVFAGVFGLVWFASLAIVLWSFRND